ncbi:MAG: molecular chaperone GrpE (heat shock protein) [Candidatus Phytoplasma pruni]|uniref:nucleotide exchange factor GrpE n=1 Tax=Poinsettia branch-inducing phytoplasma TaxID=138647 RepID=UPI00035C56A2|nr:nucleotide exchange factor GrpE [Poinsettia branch-inducing phytoplasma]WEK82562.1 MAG: molecular chaperone GrpE (heat shock protein) [Candidatus Phytoplasma pruni]
MNKNKKTHNNEEKMKKSNHQTEEVKKDQDCGCQDNKKDNASQEESKNNQPEKFSKEDCDGCDKKKDEQSSSNSHDKDNSSSKDEKDLQAELLQLKTELINEKLKSQADLENLKKRLQKEKVADVKYASMNLITDMLVPLEQLGQVLEMPTEDEMLQKFLFGFKMINKQINDVLEKDGVAEIKALGEKFDPKYHHAVEKISDEKQPNGVNVAVLQKGFLYKDKIIKPAMVKINEWSENKNGENK